MFVGGRSLLQSISGRAPIRIYHKNHALFYTTVKKKNVDLEGGGTFCRRENKVLATADLCRRVAHFSTNAHRTDSKIGSP